MPSSAPIVALNAHVRAAFDEAWLAIFETRVRAPLDTRDQHNCLLGFAAHYRRLAALPRRTRRSMERKWKRTLSAIALLMTLGQAPAWAATIEVTPGTPPSIKADGKCSLIEAIVNANRDARRHLDCVAGSGADTIILPLKSTQKLGVEEALPGVTSVIRIEGRDSTITRTTPSYDLPLLHVGATGDLTLNHTVISGASDLEPNQFDYGYGGIFNAGGKLHLTNSRILDTGAGAAGLTNQGGTVTLLRSTVSGVKNFYGGGGPGGIQNAGGGSLTLVNSTVANNSGGGINNRDGTVTVTDSIVSHNSDYRGSGGGIGNDGRLTLVGSTVSGNWGNSGGGISNSGTATLIRSTISDNFGYLDAGGIQNTEGTLRVHNSTVSGNNAQDYGGGIRNRGTLVLANSTVTGNSATQGGGLYNTGRATLRRSLITGNTTVQNHPYVITAGPEIYNASKYGAVIVAADFNLFGHDGDAGTVGFTPGSTDMLPNKTVEAILLPLADNGGGTKTHALAIGSPALDASPDDATCPPTDQRGNPRPRGPACDIGAFEGVAVLCNGKVTTMVGTINDDQLTGTAGPDVISGLLGNDTITGLEGNDVICTGAGDDAVYGGAGADLVFGEPGNDRLFGQGGNDTLNGGVGQDQCDGGPGAGDTATACENVSGVP
jgi:hypothetical protein